MKKDLYKIGSVILIIALILTLVFSIPKKKNKEIYDLPKPEVTSGIRGEQFGIDKNINEETIDKYLFRFN